MYITLYHFLLHFIGEDNETGGVKWPTQGHISNKKQSPRCQSRHSGSKVCALGITCSCPSWANKIFLKSEEHTFKCIPKILHSHTNPANLIFSNNIMALLAYDTALSRLFLYIILDIKSVAEIRIKFLSSTFTVFFVYKNIQTNKVLGTAICQTQVE